MLVQRRALTAKLSLLFAAMSSVCLAQFPPPSDSSQYAAKVLTMSGQVSVLKDTILFGLTDGMTVQVQQMIVTGPDGHATFQVSDGSTFEVFPNSHLVFRKNAWNVKDLIDLLVGRIRVHIEHLGNIPNPNRVLTPTAVISVRGTTFEVSVNEEDETTVIEVEDGLVEVRHALLPSDRSKMLGPGDSIKIYKSQPLDARLFDRGTMWHFAIRAVQDAANVASLKIPHGALGTQPGQSPDKGKGPAPPTGPPVPPGHFVDSGVSDSQTQHPHSIGAIVRGTAKWSIRWLREMAGISPTPIMPLPIL